MPYKSISDLPDSVRDNVPKHAQEIYKAFDTTGNGGVDFSGIVRHVRSLAGKG